MKANLLVTVAVAAIGVTGPAYAQTQQETAQVINDVNEQENDTADQAAGGVQDIVVTANRFATSQQTVPISIQAYTGDDLKDRGVTDIASLVQTDSSLNINYSAGQPIIAIRGISTQNTTELGDPAVSVATDGIFNNRPYGIFGGMYDVARVEILRGPQGTLFGRNSTGGTINIISNRPVDHVEGGLTAEIGNYDYISMQAFYNLPLGEGLSARVSGNLRSRTGYRRNPPQELRGDDDDVKSLRLQLAWHSPDHSWDIWGLLQYSALGGTGAVRETRMFKYAPGVPVGGEPIHEIPPEISKDGKEFFALVPYIRDLKRTEIRGGITYTFDNEVSINYLGGFDDTYYLREQSIAPFIAGVGNGPLPVPRIYHNTETPQTINQELRLAGNPRARFVWQLGAYYFRENSTLNAYTQYNPGSNRAAKGVEFFYAPINAISRAVYAQGTFALTEQLKLTAGGRYTWDKKFRDGTFLIYPAQTGLPFTITNPQTGTSKSDKPTWVVGVDYQATPENMLYAKVSTGYKVGGFNDAQSQYGPESVTAYEVGTKNYFFDRHLMFNLSAFRMDYSDQQVTQFVAGNQSSGARTVNAGKSRIWGAELNTQLQGDGFGRLVVSANYTDAKYVDFITSAGWNAMIAQNLSGNVLPLAPKWSISALYEYPIELANGGAIIPAVSAKHQSEQFFMSQNYNSSRQKAYTLVDASLTYESPDGRWSAAVWGKNIFDRVVFSDAVEFYLNNNYQFSYQPPATVGLRFSFNFN